MKQALTIPPRFFCSHVVEYGSAAFGVASVSIPTTAAELILPIACAVSLPLILVLVLGNLAS